MTAFAFALLFLMQIGGPDQTPVTVLGDRSITPSIASMPAWYQTMHERLIREDSSGAQKDVTELAQMYEQHPEVRFLVTMLLSDVGGQRTQTDTADIYKPIIPTLVAHLFDSDKTTRHEAIRILSTLRPSPPFEILEPAIKLSYWETDATATYTPLTVAAMFCKQSKQAIQALHDAAAPDQPPEKRVWAFQTIGQAGRLECRDPELTDAVLQGLRSDPVDEAADRTDRTVDIGHGPQTQSSFHIYTKPYPGTNTPRPNVVAAAIWAVASFGLEAEPLKQDLERIAADQSHPQSALTAKTVLIQLQR